MNKPRLHNLRILPFAIAVLLYGVVAVLLRHMPVSGDAMDYMRDAELLLQSGTTDLPVFYYPPGTSYWLLILSKVTGGMYSARLLSGSILVVAAVWLAQILTNHIAFRTHVATLAGIFAAFYVPMLLLASQPFPQILSLVCLGVTAVCWLKALEPGSAGRGAAELESPVSGVDLGPHPPDTQMPLPQGAASSLAPRPHMLEAGGGGIHCPGDRGLQAMGWVYFAFAGLTLGYGALTRPASLSVGLAFAVTGLYACFRDARGNWAEQSRMIAGAGVCLLVAGLTVAPVVLHNYRGGAGLTLSINNERNFWLGNNPYTPLYKTTHLAQRSLDELPQETRHYLESHYIREDITDANLRVARSRELRVQRMASALKHIKARPDLFLLRTLNRIRAFWGFDYLASRQIQEWQGWSLKQAAPLYLLEAGSYCAVMALALVGLGAGPAPPHAGRAEEGYPHTPIHFPGFLIAFILAYQLPYCFAFSAGTYHFPVMVLVFPLAAIGLARLRERGIRPVFRDWRVCITLIIFALIQVEYAYFALKYA